MDLFQIKKDRVTDLGRVLLYTEAGCVFPDTSTKAGKRIALYFEKCEKAFEDAKRNGLKKYCAGLREKTPGRGPFTAVFSAKAYESEKIITTEIGLTLKDRDEILKSGIVRRTWDKKRGITLKNATP